MTTIHGRQVTVLGSINMDLVIRCAHLPAPGETVIAQSSLEVSGGKGANQAVAAARLGANVTMVGCVGDDAFADRLLETLRREQVNVSHVTQRSQCASGLAVVAVEDGGENSILVVPGANGMVGIDDVQAARDCIRTADALLLQLEIPVPAVSAAIQMARECSTRAILNPAPASNQLPPQLLEVDLLCPNQTEAALILGRDIDGVRAARDAARELTKRGARHVVITLGDQGAVVSDGGPAEWIKPFAVNAIDSTAAGDALAGALAVFWHGDTDVFTAVRWASAAGALATTRLGAQPSLPSYDEVLRLAKKG